MSDREIKSIDIINVSKAYKVKNTIKRPLDNVSLSIPTNMSIGILGRNGAGKSTLINLISGTIFPDSGKISRNNLKISWPLGGGGFQGSLTAIDNIKFICRVMGKDIAKTIEYVEEFAELGVFLSAPLKTYSSGMKSRFAFGVCMAMDFDTYLVDEGFSAGDARFRAKTQELFAEKRKKSNMICVSHNIGTINNFCDYAAILDKGKITLYDDMQEAFSVYKKL